MLSLFRNLSSSNARSGPPGLDASTHSVGASSHGAGRCCLICLDDDIEENDYLLYGICDCRATAVHRSCLEKLINSRRRRRQPLEQRLQCDVCLHPYAVNVKTAYIVPSDIAPPRPIYRQPLVVRNQQVQIAASCLFSLLLQCIFSFASPRLTFVLLGMLALVLMIYSAHTTANSRSVRLILPPRGDEPVQPVDPLSLDDEAFYARVFVAERQTYLAQSEEPLPTSPEAQRAEQLLLISDERVPGTRRRGPQQAPCAEDPPQAGLPQASESAASKGVPSVRNGDNLSKQHVAREPVVMHFASAPLLGSSQGSDDDELTPPLVGRSSSFTVRSVSPTPVGDLLLRTTRARLATT